MMAAFNIDDVVRVRGWRGTFRVKGVAGDGSLTLWGGPSGRYATRNAMPDCARRVRRGAPDRIPEMAAPASRKAGRR